MAEDILVQSAPSGKISRQKLCTNCVNAFVMQRCGQRCCSEECGKERMRVGRLKSGRTSGERKHKEGVAKYTRTCRQCGTGFVMRKPSGKALRGRVEEGQFCSNKCKFAARRKYESKSEARQAERKKVRLIALLSAKECKECAGLFISRGNLEYIICGKCRALADRVAKVSYRAAKRKADRRRHQRECPECGKYFETEKFNTKFCTTACWHKYHKRIWRVADKARRKGATIEFINPMAVFERDNWRCHICGKKTLKSKRGSPHLRAPELDHLLPISKGGAHNYANVACACRECNGQKSDNPSGQTLLFPKPATKRSIGGEYNNLG